MRAGESDMVDGLKSLRGGGCAKPAEPLNELNPRTSRIPKEDPIR